jgi:hypothetical protein
MALFWSAHLPRKGMSVSGQSGQCFASRIHWFRIHHFRLNRVPIQIRIQGLITKNWRKKITTGKKCYFFGKKFQYFSLCLHKGRPSYSRTLEHIYHFKILHFLTFFYFSGSFLLRQKVTVPTVPVPQNWWDKNWQIGVSKRDERYSGRQCSDP